MVPISMVSGIGVVRAASISSALRRAFPKKLAVPYYSLPE